MFLVRVVLEEEGSADSVSRDEVRGKFRGTTVGVLVIHALFRVGRIHDGVGVVRIHIDIVAVLIVEGAEFNGAGFADAGIGVQVVAGEIPIGPLPEAAESGGRVGTLIERHALVALLIRVAQDVFVLALGRPADAAAEFFVAVAGVVQMIGHDDVRKGGVLVDLEIAGKRDVVDLRPIETALEEKVMPTGAEVQGGEQSIAGAGSDERFAFEQFGGLASDKIDGAA